MAVGYGLDKADIGNMCHGTVVRKKENQWPEKKWQQVWHWRPDMICKDPVGILNRTSNERASDGFTSFRSLVIPRLQSFEGKFTQFMF